LRRNGHAKTNKMSYFLGLGSKCGSSYCCFSEQKSAFALNEHVFQNLGTAPVFHFVIAKSKSGITELDLFFPEPPDRARSFGTLRPIKFQKFVVLELEVQNSCLKMSTPLKVIRKGPMDGL